MGFEDFRQIKDCMKGLFERFCEKLTNLATFVTLLIIFVQPWLILAGFHCWRVPFWPKAAGRRILLIIEEIKHRFVDPGNFWQFALLARTLLTTSVNYY